MQKLNRIFISGILCMVSCMVFLGCKTKDDEVFIKADNFDTSYSTESSETDLTVEATDNHVESEAPYYVYVCGAVNSPGVYALSPDSRIYDAIEAANGFTDEASRDYLNLAELIIDGEMIYAPTVDEASDRERFSESRQDPEKDSDGKININTASKELLTTLSGIGNGKAENIISYREENGRFAAIDDIKNVSGIGDSIFESIKDFITVN